MRCLTLHQPWAQAIARGIKMYETRSWSTKHRGDLAIHAAAKDTPSLRALCKALLGTEDVPRGSIVCVVTLEDVVRTEDVRDALSRREVSFGNFADGRYAWKFANVRPLVPPLGARGFQGLFELPDAAIKERL